MSLYSSMESTITQEENRGAMTALRKIILMGGGVILGTLGLNTTSAWADPPRVGGVVQFTAIRQEGNDAFVFGLERVRLKWSGEVDDRTRYKLHVALKKAAVARDKDGDTPALIKDAIITRRLGHGATLMAGKFKTPVGMEYNTSGSRLDVVKRGLGQRLVFERNAGMMLQIEQPRGLPWSAAVGVFNPGPNQANAVGNAAAGQDYTLAGRVTARPVSGVYGEVSGGLATTSVQGQHDVALVSAGIRVTALTRLTLKGEVLWRDDEQNAAVDGTDFYVQAGYLVHPRVENVIKYERLDVTAEGGDRADLTLGVNLFQNPRVHHQSRLQVDAVLSDAPHGDAVQIMMQTAF